MNAFLVMPGGDVHSIERIGGVKAVENALLILETNTGEILDWTDAPTPVAEAWRNEVAALLAGYRPNRALKQVDWLAVAARVDPAWARTQGWQQAEPASPDAAAAVSSPASAAAPVRRAGARSALPEAE